MFGKQQITDETIERTAKKGIFKRTKSKIVLVMLIALFLVAAGFYLKKSHFYTDTKTTKLGFEDIGELATQSSTCTCVKVEKKDRKVLGVTIPGTQSQKIYSYDTEVKAGADFSEVKLEVSKTEPYKIYVSIPKMKILSTVVDYDSLKVYVEEESIFAPFRLEEHNEAMKQLEETAKEDAVANGLLEKAYDNAKTLLTAFIGQAYDLDQYTIEFSEQE